MPSTDTDPTTAPAGPMAYPDGSPPLYRYRFTGTERSLLQWLVEHGAVHQPVYAPYATVAAALLTTPETVRTAFRGLVGHGLVERLEERAPVFQLHPLDSITALCGCQHHGPSPRLPYGVGQGAPVC